MRTLLRYVSRGCLVPGLILLAAVAASSSASAAQTILVSTGAVWRYFAEGSEPAPGWQNPAFDDSAWAVGAAELGFGDRDETTVIPSVNTAYFRATFTVANPADIISAFADVWRDDGVIVYINGVEVLRDNMPPFPPTYSTLASGAALDDGEDPVRGNITPGLLLAGLNTIAVEVHQSSLQSTDLTFDLMLVADTVVMNQAPTASSQSLVAVQGVPTPIILSGSDPDGNPLTFTLTSSPAHGTLTGNAPNLSYRSASAYVGPDSFTFKVNDGLADSADATVSIQVLAPPNQSPVANNQSVVAMQGVATAILLTGSDPDGDPLTYIVTGSPAHGTLSGTAPNLSYRSASDYIGPDSFTFKVNDGLADSVDATVSIQVLAPPNPPDIVSAVGDCSGRVVTVTFDEPVDESSATDAFNYLVVDSLGTPSQVLAAVLGTDQRTVTLALLTVLNPALTYSLDVVNICDLSGDCLEHQVVPIQFNSTPVVIACDVAQDLLWPPNHVSIDVGLVAVSSAPNLQVQVFSDEPDSGGDAVFANGVLRLSSQREGKSDGRVYLIVVTSLDTCGNPAVCCRAVVAPHDSSQAALNAVNAQASAALAGCSPNGSPTTPYRLLP